MSPTDCPAVDTLERFLAGTLITPDDTRIADHIDGCTSCQKRLDTLSAGPVNGTPASLSVADASAVEALLTQMKAVGAPSMVEAGPPVRRGAIPPPQVPGYDIVAELGRGGLGIVYKAVHRTLNRTVALKMILSGVGTSEVERSRFLVEAEATARLQHANIVQLFEVGEVDGRPYLALEYIPGGTLHQRTGDRPQQPLAAAQLIETLARAVDAAHQQQVVHRDLKPHNVLLAPAINPVTVADREFGVPKLTDFGLAKRLDAAQTTMSRTVSGTPSYMAPEQIPEGIAAGPRPPVGPLVDVYALGAVLYHLLTGRPPFVGVDWITTLLQTVRRDPVPVRQLQPGVPRDLETICLKCLEKDPRRRYGSAADLADDLRRFLDREPIRARPVGSGERMLKWARRRPVAAAAVGVAGLGVVTAFIGLMAALAAVDAQRNAEARAAAEARGREQVVLKSRIEADRLRAEADGNLYLSRIAQTYLLWRDFDLGKARLTLADCREEFRGWEWRYLNRLCNDGLAVVSLPTGYKAVAVTNGPGWFAAAGEASPPPGQPPANPVVCVWSDDGIERLRTLAPIPGRPLRIAATPAGRLMVVVEQPGGRHHHDQLFVWDLPEEESTQAAPPPIHNLPLGHHWDITPDGRFAATCHVGDDQKFQVFDIDRDETVFDRSIGHHTSGLAVSADGSLISWANRNTVSVIRRDNERELAVWPAQRAEGLAFSPDGTSLAYVDHDGPMVVVRSVEHPETSPIKFPEVAPLVGSISGPRFTADGKSLFAWMPDGVRLWSLDGSVSTTLGNLSGRIHEVVPGPDGRTIATAGNDSTTRLWAIGGRGPTAQPGEIYRGHNGPVLAVRFSTDGRRLLTGGADGVIAVRDLTRPQAVLNGLAARDPTASDSLWFLPDGRLMELGSDKRSLWDPSAGVLECQEPLGPVADSKRGTASIPVSTAGNRFATMADSRNVAVVWRLTPKSESPASGPLSAVREFELRGHKYPITAIAMSQNRSVIVTGSAGLEPASVRPRPVGELCIWDGHSGRLLHRLEDQDLCVSGIALTSTGRSAAVATGWPGWDRPKEPAPPATLRVLSTATARLGSPIANDRQGSNPFVRLAIHPEDRLVAVVPHRHSDTILTYDLLDGNKQWERAGSGAISGLAFHPDGSRLAAAGIGGVTLLEAQTGSEALRLPVGDIRPHGLAGAGGHVAFDPTGERLAAVIAGTMLIWEASSNPATDRAAWRSAAAKRASAWYRQKLDGAPPSSFEAEYYRGELDRQNR